MIDLIRKIKKEFRETKEMPSDIDLRVRIKNNSKKRKNNG